jgi:methionine-gamma-lyase
MSSNSQQSNSHGNCKGFASRLVHAGNQKDPLGSVVTPIYQCSTFAFECAQQGANRFAGTEEGYIYTRIANPTTRALEDCVANLEEGCCAVATSSGMGAVATVLLALLGKDQHIVCTGSVYGATFGLIHKHLSRFGVSADFVDTTDLPGMEAVMRPSTKVVYVETPSNPTMQITDIRAVADLAHRHGALLVVDSTFGSPYLQRPLTLGADVVLHSVTKSINGHADVVGGIAVARDLALGKQLTDSMRHLGCNMDPHQAFLVHRGLKTLALRMQRAQESALVIAQWLEARPEVAWVRYPGLPSHPQHELAKTQMSGFGAMLSFEMRGGLEAGRRLMDTVQLATLAVSLGGVETLIEHPASMTHAGIPADERQKSGITDGLVRYSVGIEDAQDLINDLAQAFTKLD